MSYPRGDIHSKINKAMAITWIQINRMNTHDIMSNGSEMQRNEVHFFEMLQEQHNSSNGDWRTRVD